ncbi:hypothetical protein [Luedemannella flava]|uniref:hypothetical protein n=1 Tax=Luedemannella flava TaxID=349316 RepID=UPI0031D087C6
MSWASVALIRFEPVNDLLPESNGFAGVFVVAGVLLVVGLPVATIVGRLVARALRLGRPGALAAWGLLGAVVAYLVGSKVLTSVGLVGHPVILVLICLPYAAIAALPAFAAPSRGTSTPAAG